MIFVDTNAAAAAGGGEGEITAAIGRVGGDVGGSGLQTTVASMELW